MASKWREFNVHEVIPENETKPFLAANHGDKFVEQDAWIGKQWHVVERQALDEALELIGELESTLKTACRFMSDSGYEYYLSYEPEKQMFKDQLNALLKIKAFKDRGSE